MGESDSEDDYMSDKFLNPPPSSIKTTSRISWKQKPCSKSESKVVSTKQQMQDKLEEGLSTKLKADNVGFKMLMKMGFKGEGGLGRNAEGRSDPVPIELVEGRMGLGLHNSRKRRSEALAAHRDRREAKMSEFQVDFRGSMANRFRMEHIQRKLNAARSICKRLDLANSIDAPACADFWPPDNTRSKLLDQAEIIRREICRSQTRPPDGRKKWRQQPSALRQPDDDEDSCLEELYERKGGYNTVLGRESDEEEYCDIDAAQHGTIEAKPDEILLPLVAYLRQSHLYCFWCGTLFNDSKDMQDVCPGPDEDDHG